MRSLSIFGTSSDAGKSTIAFALTYLLHKRGYKVAPFKAQNVSNNACVCDYGGEIAKPQHFCAEAINLPTRSDFNPVLLKSGRGSKAALILNGVACREEDVHSYYENLDGLKPVVSQAYENLLDTFECVVAEGAGSPVELNLMDKDLSNIYIAKKYHTKIILVADIERGGVFASIWGVYNLLPNELKENVIGVIVNKFRGDISLFDEGVTIIEKQFGLSVLGVIPYRPFNLGFEDSQSLLNYTQYKKSPIIKVGVISWPHLSNYNDIEPLIADAEVELSFITQPSQLTACDVVILPGSKRTFDDLKWLKQGGFESALQEFNGLIVAICGGYEMLFDTLIDEDGVEVNRGETAYGLGIISDSIIFKTNKTVTKKSYNIFNLKLNGYEIHNGQTRVFSYEDDCIYGTFVHGIFDNDNFREMIFRRVNSSYTGYDFMEYKRKSIAEFALHVDLNIDMSSIVKVLNE